MTQVIGELNIRKYDNHRWFILSRLEFVLNNGSWIRVRRGFILDFGSTPRSLWAIMPPLGTAADLGYAAHDGVYGKNRDDSPYVDLSHSFTRKEADMAMREVHLHCGVSVELSDASYLGVRRGASRAWMSPQQKLASGIIHQLPDYYDQ